MTRRAVFLLVLALAILVPAQAQAVGVWDPNDARGRYDFRWIGATHTSTDRIRLTVTFYVGFDADKLPHRESFSPGAAVELDENTAGLFWLNDRGDVVFSYGDFASSCCRIYPVAQPAPRMLVVRYHAGDYGDPGYDIHGWSTWRRDGHLVHDKTRVFHLAA